MEVGGTELTIYDNVDAKTGERCWGDLCRGPHVPDTRYIPQNAVKVMRSAAAYWLGDQKNEQLQRVYGTAWPSKDELKAYLDFLEEAEKRDHRRLGAELDLFSFPEEIGSGLAVFHPKGGVVRRVMEDYSRRKHETGGYEFVNSPHITKAALFEVSGHLDWYAEGMYPPMQLDAEIDADGRRPRAGRDYYLKPMNCPMHNLIFDARGRSYRELPLRLFEFGTVYRYEKSGVVQGLTRARGFTQDDAHIYCTKEQMADELDSLLTFTLDLLRDYGLDDFYLELSTRDPEQERRHRRGLGGGDRDPAQGRREAEPRARPRRGRRRFLRPEDLRPGEGRHRSHVADVDHPGRLQPARALRTGVPGVRRHPSASGHDPSRPVRIDRAILRGAARALRRCVPALARPGPGRCHPHHRRAQRLPVRRGRSAEAARGSRRGRHVRRSHAEEDPHGADGSKVPYMLIAGDDDVAAGAVSFRYRDGTQKNGVAIATPSTRSSRRSTRASRSDMTDGWERLYTPHRMVYLRGEGKPDNDDAGLRVPLLPCAGPA